MRLRGVVIRRAKRSIIAKERKNLDVDVKIRSSKQLHDTRRADCPLRSEGYDVTLN